MLNGVIFVFVHHMAFHLSILLLMTHFGSVVSKSDDFCFKFVVPSFSHTMHCTIYSRLDRSVLIKRIVFIYVVNVYKYNKSQH